MKEELHGLRGIACLSVILHHFQYFYFSNLDFLPVYKFFDLSLAHLFLRILSHGKLGVYIFFILSGYVLSLKFINSYNQSNYDNNIYKSIIGRYPRLMLPVLVSMVISYLIFQYCDINHQIILNKFDDLHRLDNISLKCVSFLHTLKISAFSIFLNFDVKHELLSLNPVLWTISLELWGSYFVFFTLGTFKSYRIRYIFI